MENQVARRMNMVMGHFAGNEDVSATHVLPMNCSSSINSMIRRCDNRTFFARQGSSSQACFMRQVSIKQKCGQGGSFLQGVTPSCSDSVKEDSFDVSGAPLFSRVSHTKPDLQNVVAHKPAIQECKLPATEPPQFGRPNQGLSGQKQFFSNKIMEATRFNGIEWSPRMDFAESGSCYVMTVELPGVSINDIRVEVDDQKLTVMGRRSTQWWRVSIGSEDLVPAYQRREILQGPYQVTWPLPSDVNKDGVTAEFVDGFLRITLPKL